MSKEPENEQGPDELIALLDAVDMLPGASELRHRSYELLHLVPGETVVDVGCGAGRAVAELAETGLTAIGVDPDERMVEVARQRWSGTDFRMADAYRLPFADATVDGYRSDKVFHELAQPSRALGEAQRILAPGGRIVLVGQDWDTFVIDSDDPVLTRTIVHARADLVRGPQTARRYRNLLLAAGFERVTIEIHTGVFTGPAMLPVVVGLAEGACSTGAVSRAQVDVWIGEQRRRVERDRFFLALPMFVAAGAATR
ncbi:methyltransferase domain-containing protein [Streptomyces sp. NPDC006349]|uniref:methyltransferase domain-containing protein n=1 Tax=Streptomyces sp. NPDC006349 TaxID=3156757 RepID=UPI0006B8EA11|nr:methyltransferase [Streptomyces sp. NRRL WC-3753]